MAVVTEVVRAGSGTLPGALFFPSLRSSVFGASCLSAVGAPGSGCPALLFVVASGEGAFVTGTLVSCALLWVVLLLSLVVIMVPGVFSEEQVGPLPELPQALASCINKPATACDRRTNCYRLR
ncbi:MAG: hypothetical protein IPG74_15100 [Flavobacteriales bacterium]|nr:hypothetical protein [Flavobacteriales bacterium]